MSFRSAYVKKVFVRIVGLMFVAVAALIVSAQSTTSAVPPNWRLPGESSGVDGIVRSLISVFDQADVVALGEDHGEKRDSDLRIALVRHPDFAKKVRFIVVEFGSVSEQSTLDRYIRGENVSAAELAQVWKATESGRRGGWNSPIYPDFFAAVRDVNSRLPADAQIRVFGGDPGPAGARNRDDIAVSILEGQVFQRHGKACLFTDSRTLLGPWAIPSPASEAGSQNFWKSSIPVAASW